MTAGFWRSPGATRVGRRTGDRALPDRLWLEPRARRAVDAAPLPVAAPAAERQRVLLGLRRRLARLQPVDLDLDPQRGDDPLRAVTLLRNVRPAATGASERLRIAGDDHGGPQPGDGDGRNHRPVPGDAAVAFGSAHVAPAYSDERRALAQRQGAGERRLAERRGRGHCQPGRRSLPSGLRDPVAGGRLAVFAVGTLLGPGTVPFPRGC